MDDPDRLVEACVVGVHANQAMMGAFPDAGLSKEELASLDERFGTLARGDEAEVNELLASPLRPPDDSPVRLVERMLAREAPSAKKADRKAVANLWHTPLPSPG